MYSPQLLDHFQNPRNAGELADADATVEIENPVCGDIVRLSLRMNDGTISEIRFKAKGCVPAMACGSAITELIQAVGGLPQASSHAAQLALDALAAALAKMKT